MNIIIITIKQCSKRLPNKNLLNLAGKPLCFYALNTAAAFGENKKDWDLVVSTESHDVGNMVLKYYSPIKVVKRPKWLAEDPFEIKDVCKYVLDFLDTGIKRYQTMIMLQPSNPFITAQDLSSGYELFLANNRTAIRSVVKASKPVYKALMLHSSGRLLPWMFSELSRIDNSNFHTDTYYGNGGFVIVDVNEFLDKKTLMMDNT